MMHRGNPQRVRLAAARRRPWVFALCLAGVLLAACASQEEQVAEFRERGDSYTQSEQWNEAIIEYRNVLRLDPNDAAAHHALAQAYLRVEKPREAYWELHEAARLDPENVQAVLAYGRMATAAGEFDEALAQADAVLRVDPDNTLAHIMRGRAYEGTGRYGDAEAAYLKAREMDPEESAHLLILASFYERRQQSDKAEPLFVEFTERSPGFASYTAIARFLTLKQGRESEAEEAFRAALEKSEGPEWAAATKNLAGFLYTQQRTVEAMQVLERGIEESEEKLDLLYLLARFRRIQGEREEAEALLRRAAAESENDARPYLVLSAYLGQEGDLDEALTAANQALAIEPDNRLALLRKAELLVDTGYREDQPDRLREGQQIVEAVLVQAPTDPNALFVRAKIQMANSDVEGAIQSLREVTNARKDWAQAHFVLASALAIHGDMAGARSELAKAVEKDPSLIEARRLLAQVHAQLGEHEYAIEQARIFLKENPGDGPTRILLAQSLVHIGRPDEAVSALESIPESARGEDALYALGRLEASRGNMARARQVLLQADARRPNHPDILRSLMGVEQRLGRLPDSVARVDKAIAAEPENAGLYLLRGALAMTSGKPDAATTAEAAFQKAIELDPNDAGAYEQLATLYRATGKLEKTIETYEQAIEARPDQAHLHHFLGVLYELAGEPDKAVARYQAAIDRDHTLGESMNNLAYLLAERGENLDRALDLAQEAKALLPESPYASDTLGWVLYKRGVASAAVGYLREAEAGMEPTQDTLGVVRHHLALAYEANGEVEKAIGALERALALAKSREDEDRLEGRPSRAPAWTPAVRAMLERLQAAPS